MRANLIRLNEIRLKGVEPLSLVPETSVLAIELQARRGEAMPYCGKSSTRENSELSRKRTILKIS